MTALLKLVVLVFAFVGLYFTAPAWFPVLNTAAFMLGSFAITWLYLVLAGVVGGGFVYLRAK